MAHTTAPRAMRPCFTSISTAKRRICVSFFDDADTRHARNKRAKNDQWLSFLTLETKEWSCNRSIARTKHGQNCTAKRIVQSDGEGVKRVDVKGYFRKFPLLGRCIIRPLALYKAADHASQTPTYHSASKPQAAQHRQAGTPTTTDCQHRAARRLRCIAPVQDNQASPSVPIMTYHPPVPITNCRPLLRSSGIASSASSQVSAWVGPVPLLPSPSLPLHRSRFLSWC